MELVNFAFTGAFHTDTLRTKSHRRYAGAIETPTVKAATGSCLTSQMQHHFNVQIAEAQPTSVIFVMDLPYKVTTPVQLVELMEQVAE